MPFCSSSLPTYATTGLRVVRSHNRSRSACVFSDLRSMVPIE